MVHKLECIREHITGTFDNSKEPVIRIADGDSILCRALDGDWHLEKPPVPKTGAGKFFEGKNAETDSGHCLIGPVYIEGAKKGKTLAVRINECRPAAWGWSRVGLADKNHMERLGIEKMEEYFLNWDLDPERMIGISDRGHEVRLNPFLGVMGVAPEEKGIFSTHPPRRAGGNFDCKLLGAGTTLYLPILCDGALFYVGDGHAAQGDGELGGTAIECTMDRIDLTFTMLDQTISNPRAKTQDAWVTFGFGEDLTDAAYEALREMASLISEQYGMGLQEALAMASLVVDEHVTQIVNGVRGVHAILRNGSIHRQGCNFVQSGDCEKR